MKKNLFIILVILVISIIANARTTITLVCEDKEDFPELIGNSGEISKNDPGIMIEIINLLSEKLDIDVKIERVPWTRALEVSLKNGDADGLFLASYKKEREEFGKFPMKNGKIDTERKYKSANYVFYKLKNREINWDGKGLKEFNGIIGAPMGYSISDDLKKMGYKVDLSPKTLNDMLKLVSGRIDLVAALEDQGDMILESDTELAKKIEKIKIPIVSKDYYLMLSNQFIKKNPELAEKIWNTLKEIKNNNYKKLYIKYNR